MGKKITEKLKRLTWDFAIQWIISPQGMGILSLVAGVAMATLAVFTQALNPYAPLSYGVAFFVAVILMLLIARMVRWILSNRPKRIETYLELAYNGESFTQLARRNIYGWRGVMVGRQASSSEGEPVMTHLVFACFQTPIPADTVITRYYGGTTSRLITTDTKVFEARYAIVQLNLREEGHYKLNFNYH